MISARRLHRGLPDIAILKRITISCHLNHTLALDLASSSINLLESPCSSRDPAKTVAARVSNCTHVEELNRMYAHIIRTHFLFVYSAAFHWNNILRSYTRLEAPEKALQIFVWMFGTGILPDNYTLPIVIKAACQTFDFWVGKQLHCLALTLGLASQEHCECGFIMLYSRTGEFEDAHKMFAENPDRKLGSWNAIISGTSQSGRAKEAIEMFSQMRKCGFRPDDVTIVCVTSACGSLGDLSLALQLHRHVFHAKGCEKPDVLMMNSIIDMYGKCGRMDLASKVFLRTTHKNVSSWTSMIVGYATHGRVQEAIACFSCMRESEVMPNDVTFIGVLSACARGGKVQEGRHYFDMMRNIYGIMPRLQHYGCMVDLLGRAGLFEEAAEMVEEMPMKANAVIWGCLMGASEKYGNVKMGEWAATNLLHLEPWNDGVYVVLSNIYACNGLWKRMEKMREVMKDRRIGKVPAYSSATGSE